MEEACLMGIHMEIICIILNTLSEKSEEKPSSISIWIATQCEQYIS